MQGGTSACKLPGAEQTQPCMSDLPSLFDVEFKPLLTLSGWGF